MPGETAQNSSGKKAANWKDRGEKIKRRKKKEKEGKNERKENRRTKRKPPEGKFCRGNSMAKTRYGWEGEGTAATINARIPSNQCPRSEELRFSLFLSICTKLPLHTNEAA